jgi:drug/metabolite transporter (DMT)-like permease
MNIKNVELSILLFAFLSLSSVFMKFASLEKILLYKGIYYCLSIFTLGIFALLWQKLLKKYDLSKVYVFKATTIIWGMLFGFLIFGEKIKFTMIIGSIITILGIIIVIKEGKHE